MSEKHELKVWPGYFKDIKSGAKNFEVRLNDRGFVAGDTLLLREWNPILKKYGESESIERKVKFVLYGGKFGIDPDYVVMGFEDAEIASLNDSHYRNGYNKGVIDCRLKKDEVIKSLEKQLSEANGKIEAMATEMSDYKENDYSVGYNKGYLQRLEDHATPRDTAEEEKDADR